MAVKIVTRESLAKQRPVARFADGVNLKEQISVRAEKGQHVAEFIGAGQFADAFYERQLYEVDAGRDVVPILYGDIYNTVVDANLPKTININTLGPAGVVFEKVLEGGEVKFVSLTEGSKTMSMVHYAAGLEYNEEIFLYNQTWELAPIERRFGEAWNALQNHLHLYPILSYSYAAANQTAASAIGTPLWEKYIHTLEDAVTNAKADSTNPRRGPYVLLVAGANKFTWEYAMKYHLQDGANPNSSSVFGDISSIVEYDGWTGTRGKKSVTYPGVTAGKAYLVSLQYQMDDFKSYVKVPFRSQRGDGDLSRFIVEQIIWDSHFGVYANPIAAVEEITLPTS